MHTLAIERPVTRHAGWSSEPGLAEPEWLDADLPLGRSGDGHTLTLGELPGRAVVVCFWASWSWDCRNQMVALERLQRSMPHERLRIVLVNTEPVVQWRQVRERLEQQMSVLLTHDALGDAARALAAPSEVPHTVVIDADGHRRATLAGWSDERLGWLVTQANAALATTLQRA